MTGIEHGRSIERKRQRQRPILRFILRPIAPKIGWWTRCAPRIQRDIVSAEVVDVGACALLGSANFGVVVRDDLRRSGVGIIEIAGNDRLHGADDDTGRFESLFDSVGAEVAFLDGAEIIVEIQRIVGARLHTCPATDARVAIDVDNSIRAFLKRIDGTDRDAGRIGTLVAPKYGKVPAYVGELTEFGVFDRRPEVADRNVVLGLASDGAGVAAYAPRLIDDEPILHGDSVPAGANAGELAPARAL